MNEPKKRGRPSKAELAAREQAIPEPMGVVLPGKDANVAAFEAAQGYALRVWHGQSVSLPRNERIRRCNAALEGQNLPTEGVEYPE